MSVSDTSDTLRLRMMRLVRKSQLQSLTPGACVDAILEEMFRPGDDVWDAAKPYMDSESSNAAWWAAMLQAVRAGK